MSSTGRAKMKLGITGGIGSGKTSVCRVFGVLGIPVFSADSEAQNLMNTDDSIRSGINKIAGSDLYSGGTLDKEMLASLIFSDQGKLDRVNSLVHPAVLRRFTVWTEEQTTPYVIMEAAILFESGAASLVDRVATVTAPLGERIMRVTRRNKLSKAQIMERVRNQMEDEERVRLSDYVINNSENEMIIPVILGIHEDILRHLNT